MVGVYKQKKFNMNIVITGSTGFVGTNLTKYFSTNHLLYQTISRQQLLHNNITIGSNAIVHLAGKAHDLKNISDPSEYYYVNTEVTKRIFNDFLESNCSKFIFVSSVKAAADSIDGILNEDIHPSPATHYGKSKLMAEDYILSQHLPVGKSVYILRPCMIHGPGNKGNLNLLYKFIRSGIPYPLASYNNNRSFLSVGNLCYVIKELITTEIPSGIYNVSDNEPVSTNEVITLMCHAMGIKPKFWFVPKKIINTLTSIGDALRLPLNKDKVKKLTENYVVSNNKLLAVLTSPLPIDTREGLYLTASSFDKINNGTT